MSKGNVVQQGGLQRETEQSGEVLVRATVACDDIALEDTFEAVPDARFNCGSVAGSGGGPVPLLWARATDQDRLAAAMRADPTTEVVTRLTDRGDECLYRISWSPTVEFVVGLLTAGDGTMLDASADRDGWRVRMLYPTRDALVETTSYCERHDVAVDVRSIERMDGESTGEYGLTETQYRALKLACERGYFEIPRETQLGEVAETLGISHQALSERVRRGTEKLISHSLLCDQGDERYRD